MHKEDWSLPSLPPSLRIGPSAHLRHLQGRRRRWGREKIVLWGPWQLHGRAFPFAFLYFLEYLFFSFTNWLYKTTPSRLAEGIWLSQRHPASSQSILGEARHRGAGAPRRLGGALLRDLGRALSLSLALSRSLSLSLRSPGTELWAARTGEPTPSRLRFCHGCIPGRCIQLPPPPGLPSVQTSLLRAPPSPGSSLPAVTTGPPRADQGFSALCVRLLPLLAAGGLPTRGSLRTWPQLSGAALPSTLGWLPSRARSPPRRECSRGAEGAVRRRLQPRALLASPTSWSVYSRARWGLFAFLRQACQALGEKTSMWSTSCDSAGNSSATRRQPQAARRGAAACNRTAAAASSTGAPVRAACSKAKRRAAWALSGRSLPLLPPLLRLPPLRLPPLPLIHWMAPCCQWPQGCSKGRRGRAPNSQPGLSSTWSL